MATILEVAKLANVSKSTVSRVVANNGTVSKEARARVEKAIAKLGYRPNSFARSLKSNVSNLIGVVVVDISSPFYSQLLGGMQEVFAKEGKEMIVASGYGNAQTESQAIQSMLDRHCDGLILYVESDLSELELANSAAPIVCLGSNFASAQNNIRVANQLGGYLAAKHLIAKGHTKLVHLAGWQRYGDARERLQGFWQAVDEANINRQHCIVLEGPYEERFGYQAMQRLLIEGADFTAVCAGDDDIAAGVYSALRHGKKRIPEDVSVIGYDDNFHAKYMYPTLTTVRQPVAEMGRLAAASIVKKLPTNDDAIILEPTLIERDSVAQLLR